MVDSFGRRIDYVRISVTDRCNLRCRYCMAEHMQFLPKRDILTLGDIFIARGVRRIRLTGGEPLVRRGVGELFRALGSRIGHGLEEVTLTTNGVLLSQFAPLLADSGVRRVNVSLDSRRPDRFAHITRGGELGSVLRGIAAAREAGLKVKINMVALAGLNDDEFEDMLLWCNGEGHDLTLIETMPLGEVEEDRTCHYLALDTVRSRLDQRFTLAPSLSSTGGPARYYEVSGLSVRLGMITPLSANFCAGCNRIRVAATGTVYGCLGHDQKVELRDALRSGGAGQVDTMLDRLLAGKPKGHDFHIAAPRPAVARHMSVTGG
jgi:cyclic pyranopterin phosphate synthase